MVDVNNELVGIVGALTGKNKKKINFKREK